MQQRSSQQQAAKKKPLFEPPRGFGYDGPEPPQFANLPSDALMPPSVVAELNALEASTATLLQPQLTVGAADDQYEQEADKVARQVVDEIHGPQVSQKPQEEEDQALQRQMVIPKVQLRAAEGNGMAAPQDVEQGISQARGKGQPLSDAVREPMEQAFGADFGGVRVHADAQADQLNQSIQAKAFTTGQDVFFRAGAYQPEGKGGQELLAHELTHVVQQGRVVRRVPQIERQQFALEPISLSRLASYSGKPYIQRLIINELDDSQLSKEEVTSKISDLPKDIQSEIWEIYKDERYQWSPIANVAQRPV
ncbi:MAG: DUF4157 domain-containing protein [Spirulinaceae cyanobacterium]